MSRRKHFAALAAAIAAFAFAVPAVNASATTAPALATFELGPSSVTCQILVGVLRGAVLSGNVAYQTALGYALLYLGCGGAAI